MKRWINKSFLVKELGNAEALTQQEMHQPIQHKYSYIITYRY